MLLVAVLIALVHCSHTYDTCTARSPLCWWQCHWGALVTACGHSSSSLFLLALVNRPYAILIATLCVHDHKTCKFLISLPSLWYHTYVQSSTGPLMHILLNIDTLSNWHCSGWVCCGIIFWVVTCMLLCVLARWSNVLFYLFINNHIVWFKKYDMGYIYVGFVVLWW